MNEEIDDFEFYHQDFTTASDWEIFIARIEEILNQWKADDTPPQTVGIWSIKTESLLFADFEFKLSFYKKNVESSDSDDDKKKYPFDDTHDFELYNERNVTDHSCLSKWYGIEEFVVVYAAGDVAIVSESRIKILLSSMYIAAGNLKCDFPLFIQIREKWQNCYLGVYENDTIRSCLEMVHLRNCPRLCHYLSGLIEMFKSKIVSPTMMATITVSLQASYVLSDFGSFTFKQDTLDTETEGTVPNILPFGVTIDPIEKIILKTSWCHLNHRSVRDSESYSDFDPFLAHKWTLQTITTEQSICLLSECLNEILHVMNGTTGSVYDVLGDFVATPDVNNPLDLLTEPKVATISTLLTRAARNSRSRSKKGTAPILDEVLVPILYFLFPDADEDMSSHYKDGSNRSQVRRIKFNLY